MRVDLESAMFAVSGRGRGRSCDCGVGGMQGRHGQRSHKYSSSGGGGALQLFSFSALPSDVAVVYVETGRTWVATH